jgi:hypothetical protein
MAIHGYFKNLKEPVVINVLFKLYIYNLNFLNFN